MPKFSVTYRVKSWDPYYHPETTTVVEAESREDAIRLIKSITKGFHQIQRIKEVVR